VPEPLRPDRRVVLASTVSTFHDADVSEGDGGFLPSRVVCGVSLLVACVWVLFLNLRHKPSREAERLRRSGDASRFAMYGTRSLTTTATAVVLEPPLVRFLPIADRVVHREDTRVVYRQLVRVDQDDAPARWDDEFVIYDLTGCAVVRMRARRGTGTFERLERLGWPTVDLCHPDRLGLWAPWQLPDPPRKAADHRPEPS